MKKAIKIICAFIFLMIFFLIALNINTGFIEKLDNFIYDTVQKLNSDSVTFLFKGITFLSSPQFIIVALILCLIFIKNKKTKNFIVLNAIIVVFLNQLIKVIVARPRPSELMMVEESGFSFPSAHAMFSLAFYGVLLHYLNKMNINKKTKFLLGIILCFLIILIPITRIYLGVHYASDVIAGLCLSSFILLVYSMFPLKNDKKSSKNI